MLHGDKGVASVGFDWLGIGRGISRGYAVCSHETPRCTVDIEVLTFIRMLWSYLGGAPIETVKNCDEVSIMMVIMDHVMLLVMIQMVTIMKDDNVDLLAELVEAFLYHCTMLKPQMND